MNAHNISIIEKNLMGNDPVDVSMVDSLVNLALSADLKTRTDAQKLLDVFKEKYRAISVIKPILGGKWGGQTQFYAIQVVEDLIKSRWQILQKNDREQIRIFLIDVLVKNIDSSRGKEKNAINKRLMVVLVELVKVEWPKEWTTFVTDLITNCVRTDDLTLMCITVLRMLSEDIFVHSTGKIIHTKQEHLKNMLTNNFLIIFKTCSAILETSKNTTLLVETIYALSRFVQWCPPDFIFESQIIVRLIKTFLSNQTTTARTLDVIAEVASMKVAKYQHTSAEMFLLFTEVINSMYPQVQTIPENYKTASFEQMGILNKICIVYTNFFLSYYILFQELGTHEAFHPSLKYALEMLLNLCKCGELDMLKTAIVFWTDFALYLNTMHKANMHKNKKFPQHIINFTTELMRMIIPLMPRPEEVIIVETENGDVVREFMKDTESIDHYQQCKKVLMYITEIDPPYYRRLLEDLLNKYIGAKNFEWKNINTLCWSVGSISGALSVDEERKFIVKVIKELLNLCERIKGKNNKALVASNIMYVVRKYPRFLNCYWKFLSTVVNKLFEFMHETHEGVRDMACDAFLKIAQKCAPQFSTVQLEETSAYVERICEELETITSKLEVYHMFSIYKGIGHMIASYNDSFEKARVLQLSMASLNYEWKNILTRCLQNETILYDLKTLDRLCYILKLNTSMSSTLDEAFLVQFNMCCNDFDTLFKAFTNRINQLISMQGENAIGQVSVRKLRAVKKEILILFEQCVQNSRNKLSIMQNYIPFVINTFLPDYCNGIVRTKDSELLVLLNAVVAKLGTESESIMQNILSQAIAPTIAMINQDFTEHPEHRRHLYKLLETISTSCFSAFLSMQKSDVDLIINTVIWAFKHTMPDIAESGLRIIYHLLHNFADNNNYKLPAAQQFYQEYFVSILTHIISVIADSRQASVVESHAQIIATMIAILERNLITVTLFPMDNNAANNIINLRSYLAQIISKSFSHMHQSQINLFIDGIFVFSANKSKFVTLIVDFVLQTKTIQSESCDDIFLDDYMAELKTELEKKQNIKNASSMNRKPATTNVFENVD